MFATTHARHDSLIRTIPDHILKFIYGLCACQGTLSTDTYVENRYLFNFAGQRYIVDLVSLIVLGVQVMTVCGLWYANYKVVKNRELQEKDKGLRSKGSLLGDGSENNQSQVTTVALPDEEDEIWKR